MHCASRADLTSEPETDPISFPVFLFKPRSIGKIIRILFLEGHYMEKRKVILDCDPGHDDAISIIIAASERSTLDIAGITTVAGKDRKSTRLNSSHVSISYAVFCMKKTM